MKDDLLNRITHDPDIMVGKPVIRGARIPVDLISVFPIFRQAA